MSGTTSGSARTSEIIDADHSDTGEKSARDHNSGGADSSAGSDTPVPADSSAGGDSTERSDNLTDSDSSAGTVSPSHTDKSAGAGAGAIEERQSAKLSHRPTKVRSKGLVSNADRHHVRMHTPFGGLYVVAVEGVVVGIYHEDHDPTPGPARLGRPLHTPDGSSVDDVRGGAATSVVASAEDTKVLNRACQELAEYFDGRRLTFDFSSATTGTAFQKDVWRVLAEIPCGERRSYRDVADSLGNPAMGRAIGAAVRANPLSIVIPGHRVVSSSGKVVGYAAGTDVKTALLDFERCLCDPPDLTVADGTDTPLAPAASPARTSSGDMAPMSGQE